jgi:hypothetical protein
MDIQSMFPVYLPKLRDKDENRDDYNTQVSQNENNINQNFNILYQALSEIMKTLQGGA